MLKAFIDDSSIGTPPVYVLAGWFASDEQWVKFSNEWDAVLRMSPRIRYFKHVDAVSFNGEFSGMSVESRDEKCRLLVNVIEDNGLIGISSIMPHVIFEQYFGRSEIKEITTPYFPMVFSLIGKLIETAFARGIREPIHLVFDVQPGSNAMGYVQSAWELFKEKAPECMSSLISPNPPSYQSDTDVVALQAADLHAGFERRRGEAFLLGNPPPIPPWGDRGQKIRLVSRLWDEEFADRVYSELFGYPPIKVSWSFQYGIKD